jgi:hypothetical protein
MPFQCNNLASLRFPETDPLLFPSIPFPNPSPDISLLTSCHFPKLSKADLLTLKRSILEMKPELLTSSEKIKNVHSTVLNSALQGQTIPTSC